MLLQIAVADAYAVAWEFTDRQKGANDLSRHHGHPTHPGLRPGMYTDDTLRAIANAAVVVSGRTQWYRPESYAAAYQTIHRDDPRQGWSRGFQQLLAQHVDSDPLDFMAAIRRSRPSNGSVMGVAPLGFLPDADAVRLAATVQTISTHSPAAAPYAQAVALAAHYHIRSLGPRRALDEYLADAVDWFDDAQRRAALLPLADVPPQATISAATTTAAALWAARTFGSLSEIVRWSADHGRDTDSLAAVAVGVASCDREIEDDLPEILIRTLEDEAGRAMLVAADRRLVETLDADPAR